METDKCTFGGGPTDTVVLIFHLYISSTLFHCLNDACQWWPVLERWGKANCPGV